MAVSGRFPLLLLLGVVAVVIQPTREMVLLWVGICVAVTLVDLAIAVSPRRLDIQREPVGQVRLGAERVHLAPDHQHLRADAARLAPGRLAALRGRDG